LQGKNEFEGRTMAEASLPTNKADLIARIEERWAALTAMVAPLRAEELEQLRGDGWSVKVHLAHISAWEASLAALLRKQDRAEAMGVPPEVWDRHDTDAINDLLAGRAGAQPAVGVAAAFRATHADLMALLESLTAAELEMPYSHYQPADPDPDTRPVAGWVHGNTWDHYDEHLGWLEAGLRP